MLLHRDNDNLVFSDGANSFESAFFFNNNKTDHVLLNNKKQTCLACLYTAIFPTDVREAHATAWHIMQFS